MPTEQFNYDPLGNRLTSQGQAPGSGRSTECVYDFENRLTEVSYTGMVAQYKYDPFGRRIEKNVNGTITRYLYDGPNIVTEYDGSWNVASKYIHTLDIDDPLTVTQGANTFYYHRDGLGSVVNLTDASGNIVKGYTYKSFGEIYSQTGGLVQPFTFTGREYDPESGLYYYRARYYDPRAGRFLTKDPIGFAGGDVNLYRYVSNNPVNWVDASGLLNPTKGIAALGNAANAGRLYATGLLKIGGAAGLATTGVGTPGSTVFLAWGLWNIRGAMVAQNRALLLWEEAFKESWFDASWKNLLGVLPHGEKYDDPCEPTAKEFWWDYKIKNWWEFISELGTISP